MMTNVTSADATPEDLAARQHLAEAVRARRLELGLSVRSASEKAGIARGTWIALEDGSRRTSETAYASIERTLHWTTGSVVRLLKGLAARQAEGGSEKPSGFLLETIALQDNESPTNDPLVRVLRNPDLSDEQKARIIRTLIREQDDYARRRVDELIREVRRNS